MSSRSKIPQNIETAVLLACGRRCCICYGLGGDDSLKRGRIAHLDRDPSNSGPDNLTFLCLDHLAAYASPASPVRNLSAQQVKHYRRELHRSQARCRATCCAGLQFVLDHEFSSFTADDEQRFLNSLTETLSIDQEVLLIRREPGSTKLTVAMSAEQARRTRELYDTGAFRRLGVLAIDDVAFQYDLLPDDEGNWSDSRSPQTRWTIVMLAANGPMTEDARIALHELCTTYQKTLYRMARHHGKDDEQARDLVQEFICSLLDSRNTLATVDRTKGRFRTYLRMRFKNFMVDTYRKATAAKRGGDRKEWSIDFAMDQGHVHLEPVDGLTPDMAYRKSYALDTFQAVLDDLQSAHRRKGNYERFCRLREYLSSEVKGNKAKILASELNITQGRARGLVAELRTEFLTMLRARIAQTLADPSEGDIEQELNQFWADLNL